MRQAAAAVWDGAQQNLLEQAEQRRQAHSAGSPNEGLNHR
jgi:hypothetical protein